LNGVEFYGADPAATGRLPNNGFNTKIKDAGRRGFSVTAIQYQQLFLIDGVNNNDVGSNRTILYYPSVDSVAEFKMLTNSMAQIWAGIGCNHQHHHAFR